MESKSRNEDVKSAFAPRIRRRRDDSDPRNPYCHFVCLLIILEWISCRRDEEDQCWSVSTFQTGIHFYFDFELRFFRFTHNCWFEVEWLFVTRNTLSTDSNSRSVGGGYPAQSAQARISLPPVKQVETALASLYCWAAFLLKYVMITFRQCSMEWRWELSITKVALWSLKILTNMCRRTVRMTLEWCVYVS